MERVIKNLPLNDTVSGIKEIDASRPWLIARTFSPLFWFLMGWAFGEAFILCQLFF